jgi:UDP-glucose 4-epimerase
MGYSNREVLKKVEEISGRKISIREESRRRGDPARLVADPYKIKNELGFSPKYSDINTIVESAWKWHNK